MLVVWHILLRLFLTQFTDIKQEINIDSHCCTRGALALRYSYRKYIIVLYFPMKCRDPKNAFRNAYLVTAIRDHPPNPRVFTLHLVYNKL